MKKFVYLFAALLFVAAAVTAYAGGDVVRQASAQIYSADGQPIGWARLAEDSTGRVLVTVKVQGLTPGLHGIHLHAIGACSPTFAAAGGHHNPLSHQHGLDNPLGAHGGDLPNLSVNAAGYGFLSAVTDRATLSAGPLTLFDLDGSALIIHAAPDDQITDPTGNSGGRVACGVIQAD
jgi:Cu-Zn family superoxide dismutase